MKTARKYSYLIWFLCPFAYKYQFLSHLLVNTLDSPNTGCVKVAIVIVGKQVVNNGNYPALLKSTLIVICDCLATVFAEPLNRTRTQLK